MQTLRDIYTAGRGRRAAGGIFFGAVPVELPVGKQTGESLSVQPIEAQVPPSYGSCQVSVLQWWKPSVVNSALSVTDMRGRYKINDFRGRRGEPDSSPLLGDTAAGSPVPGAAVCGVGGIKKGAKRSIYGNDKVYLGVRVRMPVKDLLRNIRLAQGSGQDLKERYSKTAKGDLKRAKTRFRRRTVKTQQPSQSLEELSIIVEVLEEDLRTGSRNPLSPPPLSPTGPPVSPQLSPTGFNGDEYDEIIPSPPSYMTYSPGTAEYHQTPPGLMFPSCPPSIFGIVSKNGEQGEEWFGPRNYSEYNVSSTAFFWTQLQKEEGQLRDVCDVELLSADEHGRTALHRVACVGKRALGFAIAKRMATFNSLDLKDSDGMTPLLYASKHNHHLMVADLIYLGANVNETNNAGKSCLHLSAESGYIRVLEVLMHAMMDGIYVDVEATDNSGMSVVQCAAIALKATVCEVESNESLGHSKVHTLRREQMMETLECVLQMCSYLHVMRGQRMQPRTA
ncbi:NF-kappa-B inhibitor zeta [Oreochromis aureus]|nr:NF-kappa-B inhibitor zeta [Oreochromis aureus]